MNNKKDELKKLLIEKLANEIFSAEESYFILQTISENWGKISKNGYDLFFKSTYSAHMLKYILTITKLFEKPNKKYDTISIPSVLKYIEEHLNDFRLTNQTHLIKQFSLLGYEIEYLDLLSDYELNKTIFNHFKKNLPSTDYSGNLLLSKTLDFLKIYRDKQYSHNENIDIYSLPKIKFDEISNLLLFAKQFVSIYSLAYFNMFYSVDGKEFFFTEDAQRTNVSFKRILEKAGLIDFRNKIK